VHRYGILSRELTYFQVPRCERGVSRAPVDVKKVPATEKTSTLEKIANNHGSIETDMMIA